MFSRRIDPRSTDVPTTAVPLLPKKRVAIIIVPGIGGSNIFDPTSKNGFGADLGGVMLTTHLVKTAAQVREVLLSGGKWLPLVIPPSPTEQERRGWHQVASGVYHTFMKDCQENFKLSFIPEVFAIGYNFTQSNGSSGNAKRIIVRTKEIMKTDPGLQGYIYITHSMGALPTRAALKEMWASGDPKERDPLYDKCLGVIHIAAPNAGAAEVYARFFRGTPSEGGMMGTLAAYILGNTGKSFSTTASVMPSMCELLPTPDKWSEAFPTGIDAPEIPHLKEVVKEVLAGQSYQQENVDLITTHLQSARNFHRDLGEFVHPDTFAIVLTGLPTTAQVHYKGRKKLKDKPTGERVFEIRTADGDGTVTAASQAAYLVEVRTRSVKGIPHVDPLNKPGKETVFPIIYELLEELTKKRLSEARSLFPHIADGLNIAFSNEPVLLNGMKVIFDRPVSVYPVTLESKAEAERNGN